MRDELDLDLIRAIAGGKKGAIKLLIKTLEKEREQHASEVDRLKDVRASANKAATDKAIAANKAEQAKLDEPRNAVINAARKVWNIYGTRPGGRTIKGSDPELQELYAALIAFDGKVGIT